MKVLWTKRDGDAAERPEATHCSSTSMPAAVVITQPSAHRAAVAPAQGRARRGSRSASPCASPMPSPEKAPITAREVMSVR